MNEIVPHGHKDAKGTDIFGQESSQFIIRPDLGYYMKAARLHDDKQLVVYSLHPSCSKGDHYLATNKGDVYIIGGSECRVVKGGETALRDDTEPEVFQLPFQCQGGDFYFAQTNEKFYIIFSDRGQYLRVSSLRPYTKPQLVAAVAPLPDSVQAELAVPWWMRAMGMQLPKSLRPESEPQYEPFQLHSDCKGGLYYFATEDWFYVLKQVHPIWGLQYLRTRDLSKNTESSTFSIHPNVAKFLPGGLAFTMGRTFARWVKLGSVSNIRDEPLLFDDQYVHKVGYKKEKRSEIEHNWKVEVSASYNAGNPLTESLFRAQFSGTAGYGGHHISTETEDWTQESTTTKKFNVKVPAKKSVYAWQLKIGLGDQDILHLKDIAYTDTPDPPELPETD